MTTERLTYQITYLIDLSKRQKNFATKNMTARGAGNVSVDSVDGCCVLHAVVKSKKEAQLGNMDSGDHLLSVDSSSTLAR